MVSFRELHTIWTWAFEPIQSDWTHTHESKKFLNFSMRLTIGNFENFFAISNCTKRQQQKFRTEFDTKRVISTDQLKHSSGEMDISLIDFHRNIIF